MQHGNVRRNIPSDLPEEMFETLACGSGVRIERIVSRGHSSPPGFWYDQEEDEFVLVVQGAARLEVEGRAEVALAAGDWVDLPAHTRHRVNATASDEDTIWLAVFYSR